MKPLFLVIFSMLTGFSFSQAPVKVAVAGLTHGHVDWIFNSEPSVIQIVGVYEPNPELVKRYSERYKLDRSLFYSDLQEMLEQVKPEAVTAYGATSEHIEVVRAAAPLKIHVMVEKPLATPWQMHRR
jgi:predicted dehydrogenase